MMEYVIGFATTKIHHYGKEIRRNLDLFQARLVDGFEFAIDSFVLTLVLLTRFLR
jgi:hypothetical protein